MGDPKVEEVRATLVKSLENPNLSVREIQRIELKLELLDKQE